METNQKNASNFLFENKKTIMWLLLIVVCIFIFYIFANNWSAVTEGFSQGWSEVE